MSITESVFALGGLIVTLCLVAGLFLKYYADAKIASLAMDVKRLIAHMNLHDARISRLEERLK